LKSGTRSECGCARRVQCSLPSALSHLSLSLRCWCWAWQSVLPVRLP
jgi:hypothetical protein